MNDLSNHVKSVFEKRFGKQPRLFFSPGRINFIGEHVDYNDGFVMPAAIDKGVYYAVAPNDSDTLNFYALDFDESLSVKVEDVKKSENWKNYVLSVVNEFKRLDKEVKGFDCVFGGDIANGAGISSSAAVEGGLAFAINDIFSFRLDRKELALLCQRAEHNYPGVKCGIMDQYANMFGKKGSVILLDCRTVEHTYLPLQLNGYEVVLINSNVHHSLASSQYNVRRQQCEDGLRILREHEGINSFREVQNTETLDKYKDEMGDDVYRRCLFVAQEISRTKEAAKFLEQHDLISFGKLMFETHEGLSKLYEVSCNELDFLAAEAKRHDAVIGSRMMGGGFGGCTINIVKTDGADEFIATTVEKYKQQFNIDAEVYRVKPEDGTREVI